MTRTRRSTRGTITIGGSPHQPHPGARICRYRCFLPDLAGFTAYRREGTGADHHGCTTAQACRRRARSLEGNGLKVYRWQAEPAAVAAGPNQFRRQSIFSKRGPQARIAHHHPSCCLPLHAEYVAGSAELTFIVPAVHINGVGVQP